MAAQRRRSGRASSSGGEAARFCESCGTKAEQDALFCENCGASLPESSSEPGGASPNAEASKTVSLKASPRADDEEHPAHQAAPASVVPLPPRKLLIGFGLAAVAIVVVSLVVIASQNEDPPRIRAGPSPLTTPETPFEIEYMEDAIDILNRDSGPASALIRGVVQVAEITGAAVQCGIGFSVDFPDNVIVTVLSINGQYAQAAIDPAAETATLVGEGSDYRLAGISPAAFPYRCVVTSDGAVSLL
jgi:hypothetical protein